MKQVIINDIICKIGTNAKENWNLLSNTFPDNLFFHLSSFPSCYVIYECDKDNYPNEDIIEQLAQICKNNTKYRNLKNIKVDYTLCSNLTKGEEIGEVIYKSNKKVKKINI